MFNPDNSDILNPISLSSLQQTITATGDQFRAQINANFDQFLRPILRLNTEELTRNLNRDPIDISQFINTDRNRFEALLETKIVLTKNQCHEIFNSSCKPNSNFDKWCNFFNKDTKHKQKQESKQENQQASTGFDNHSYRGLKSNGTETYAKEFRPKLI